MIEDEDTKIRRNLVVVSAVIVVSAWLEIPFSSLLSKFLDSEAAPPEVYKFWTVGFAMMIYFGLRYTFSKEGGDYKSSIEKELLYFRDQKAHLLLQRQTRKFTRTGKDPQAFSEKLSELVERQLQLLGMGEAYGRPRIIVITQGLIPDLSSFFVALGYEWSGEFGTRSSKSGYSVKASITGWRRMLIEVAARLHVFFYSGSSIQYLIPATLALISVFVLWFKVVCAYVDVS